MQQDKEYFTDQHYEMLKKYRRHKNNEVFNEWVYPVLVQMVTFCYLVVTGNNRNKYDIDNMVSYVVMNLYKVDFRKNRHQVFDFLTGMIRQRIINDQKSWAIHRKRTVNIQQPINEDGDTLESVLRKVDGVHYYMDNPTMYRQFLLYWKDANRINRVFGTWYIKVGGKQTPNKIRWAFRHILFMLEGKNRQNKTRSGNQLSKKNLGKVVELMRKEMGDKFDDWMPVVDDTRC